MSNLFDATNAPEGEPLEIVAGDFIQWKVSDLVDDYPTDSYTLTYTARISGARDEFQIVATGQSNHYLVTATSTASASYSPGIYQWQKEIVRNSDSARIVLGRGTFTVKADLDIPGSDIRSHAQIMVSKIESVLSGKADSDVSSYSIAGRSLTKMSFAELLEARDYYRAEAMREKAAEDAKNGRKGKSTIQVRF
jgi:hypothetical protein